jgi:glutamyl-tRNA synthetase
MASFIFRTRPLVLEPKAEALLTPEARGMLARLLGVLAHTPEWSVQTLEARIRDFVAAEGVSLGSVAQPLRAALAGKAVSPPIFDVLHVLGRDESLARISDVATASADLGSDAPPH